MLLADSWEDETWRSKAAGPKRLWRTQVPRRRPGVAHILLDGCSSALVTVLLHLFHQFQKWNGPNTVPQKCCLFDESESHYPWYKILQNKFLANEDENAYVQLEVFGDPAPTAQWFRVTKCGVDHSSEMFTSWCRWAVKMTGTFLRAIDISSGPMELMGENETPKGFFCNTTICKTHTGRSFWVWRSARKQTRAFTGLKKENTSPFGNQINLLFGIRCVISNRFGRREHKFKLFISSKLFF